MGDLRWEGYREGGGTPLLIPLTAAAGISRGTGIAGGLAIGVQKARLREPVGDNNGDTRAVTSGAGPWGWHPPARWLSVGTGTRVTGGGCALGGITKEARFTLLTLGTLCVVLAVLGGNTSQGSGDPVLCPSPFLTSSTPHSLPSSVQKRGHRCWSGHGSHSQSRSPGRVPSSPAQNGGHSAGMTAPCSPQGTWGQSSVTVASQQQRHLAHDLAASSHLHSSTLPAGPRLVSAVLVMSMAMSLSPTLAMRPS